MKCTITAALYLALLLPAAAQYSIQGREGSINSGAHMPVIAYRDAHPSSNYRIKSGPRIAPLICSFSTRFTYKINRDWSVGVKNHCVHTIHTPAEHDELHWLWELSLEKSLGPVSLRLSCENIFNVEESPGIMLVPVPHMPLKDLYAPSEGREIELSLFIKL